MKNLLLLCFVLLIGSCTRVGPSPMYTRIGDQVEIDIVEAEYDGHSYLVFSGHGVIHNPNCKCK